MAGIWRTRRFLRLNQRLDSYALSHSRRLGHLSVVANVESHAPFHNVAPVTNFANASFLAFARSSRSRRTRSHSSPLADPQLSNLSHSHSAARQFLARILGRQ